MNRIILNAVLSLSVGAAFAASAQNTNLSGAPDWSVFQSIAQKNIFDPTRSGRRTFGPRPRPAIVRTFTFCGTIDDVAFFKGDGEPAKGYLKVGDTINGFKVMKIPVRYDDSPAVILTDPSGTIVVLQEGENMRREEEGPWFKSDQAATPAIVATETNSDQPAASASAPAGESDILTRLRLRHQQESQ